MEIFDIRHKHPEGGDGYAVVGRGVKFDDGAVAVRLKQPHVCTITFAGLYEAEHFVAGCGCTLEFKTGSL